MELWKILVQGDSAMDVHGVGLRETVHSIARSMYPQSPKGFVRNIKASRVVEIVLQVDENQANAFKGSLLEKLSAENPLVDTDRIRILGTGVVEDPYARMEAGEGGFRDFEVKREDELTEMVWALQNAGQALFLQTKIRAKALVTALASEMEYVLLLVKEIRDNQDKGILQERRFHMISVENIIREPPYIKGHSCGFLLSRCHELYGLLEMSNKIIDRGIGLEQGIMDQIEGAANEIIEEISKMAKRPNKPGGE